MIQLDPSLQPLLVVGELQLKEDVYLRQKYVRIWEDVMSVWKHCMSPVARRRQYICVTFPTLFNTACDVVPKVPFTQNLRDISAPRRILARRELTLDDLALRGFFVELALSNNGF